MSYQEIKSGCPLVRSFRKDSETLRDGEIWLWTYGFDGKSLLEYASPAVEKRIGKPWEERYDCYSSVNVSGFPLLGLRAIRADCVGTVFDCVADIYVPMVEQDRAKAASILLETYKERKKMAERELKKAEEQVARLAECSKVLGTGD